MIKLGFENKWKDSNWEDWLITFFEISKMDYSTCNGEIEVNITILNFRFNINWKKG